MKIIIIPTLFLSYFSTAQVLTKNDLPVASLELVAGYLQGWRDEVIYHPNELFKHFPKLNRTFWDNRIQSAPGFLNTEWDADHVVKSAIVLSHVTAVGVRISGRKKFKFIILDMAKYYISYKLGFFLSYNVTHKNKVL